MIQVFKPEDQNYEFYSLMGGNFASLDIAKELERQVYNKRDTTWFVATINDCAIAFVSVCEYNGHYFVDNLYTHRGWRNKGLASELIERVVTAFTDKPIKCIAVNPYAMAIFKKFGFEEVGEVGKYSKLEKH